MHLPDNFFSITLILGGIITLAVSWVTFKRTGGAVRWFSFMMLAIAIWATAYGCELSASTLNQMLFWINIEYIGISFLPPLWIIFVIGFTGKSDWLTLLNRFILFIIPAMTLVLVWTNPLHHLYYSSVAVDASGPFPMLAIKTAVWYTIFTVYFYCILAVGVFLIISRFRKADSFIKRQNRIILLGAVIPWVFNFMYLLNIRPFGHIDLTPFAFILSAIIIALGLLGFKLFDLVPIARGKIVENLQEGILVLDTQNRVIDLNREMKRITGHYTNNVIGKTPDDLFPYLEELKHTIQNQENSKVEIQLKKRIFAVTITALFEKKTVFSGKILLFRDITERKQSEDKLQELNKLKDRLFSIISHDLRSPLLSLMDILTMANDGTVTDDEFKSILPSLSKNIGYTSGLVENLLQWSKSQLEGTVINSTHFDIRKSVTYIFNIFCHIATDKGIKLNNLLDKETIVYADRDMIQAVLRNLVSNAIKFCRKGDQIQLSAEVRYGITTILIKDTGVGIAEESLEKLFGNNNFSTRGTTNEQGTGLGLLLCKDFVEKNRGKIWVKSKVDIGSRFYFSLPVDKLE